MGWNCVVDERYCKSHSCGSCPSLVYILLLSVDLHNVKLAPLYKHSSILPISASTLQRMGTAIQIIPTKVKEMHIWYSLSNPQWLPPLMDQVMNCSCPWLKINHTIWLPLPSESTLHKTLSHILGKYHRPNISMGAVRPPKRNEKLWNRKPRKGMRDVRRTRMTRIEKLERENVRWICGQGSEPRIPDKGVMSPMRMSKDACIWRDALAKSATVDVIVEKPHKP